MRRVLCLVLACLAAPGGAFAQPTYDPKPWLADLSEMRDALSRKYSDFEWAVFGREIDMGALFADAQTRIENGNSDADARATFDRLIRRLGDGHVELQWPAHGTTQANTWPVPCSNYDPVRAAKPLAAYADGYTVIDTPHSEIFPVGVITSGKHRVGVIKIRSFTPTAFPALCRDAIKMLGLPADQPCDDSCSEQINKWAEARVNESFIGQIETLKRARIDTLVVDIAGNGGGTEWAEAAARMVTGIRLKSERVKFMRGQHWAKQLAELEKNLRTAAQDASPEDRTMLLRFANEAAAKQRVAEKLCDAAPLWEGKHPNCAWLGEGFFMTGPFACADPAKLRGKPWAAKVFTPMKYQYTEGLWQGPLIVLVDGASGSASEEFAAELRDNHAALIMGEPTAGAGGGHTAGGTPTTLSHSRAILIVPDIDTVRADGGNANRGVVPDILVGYHRTDGPHLRAEAFLAELPEALSKLKYKSKSEY